MNKQELIEKYESYRDIWNATGAQSALECFLRDLDQLDEPQKVVIPQLVMDYYEFYKDKLTNFTEWFAEFEAVSDEDFQRMDDVYSWLYDVDHKTQLQRELAFATLIVNGPENVEVEKEKLYWVLGPEGNAMISKDDFDTISQTDAFSKNFQIGDKEHFVFTEQEIKSYDERYWAFAVEVEE